MLESAWRTSRWWNWPNGLPPKAVPGMMSKCFGLMSEFSLHLHPTLHTECDGRLAELGCCCFCSILYIGNEAFISQNPDKVRSFMRAVKRATDFVLSSPEQAWAEYCDFKPAMATDLNRKIFERSFAYFSKDLQNVARDWNKVTKYGKRLGVLGEDFTPNYTNEFLTWKQEEDQADPTGAQQKMVQLQKEVADKGGFRRLDVERLTTVRASA